MIPAHNPFHDRMLSDRRRSPRFYLNQRQQADILIGQRRIAVEAGQISDASAGGLGIRCNRALRAMQGMPVTVATRIDEQVTVFTGRIASNRIGFDVGIEIAESGQQRALAALANEQSGVTVAMIDRNAARVGGKISMAARHPIAWAVDAGARCLEMGAATSVDSAGLGLLLMLRERHGISIRHCSQPICNLVAMVGLTALCDGECRGAATAGRR